ncbi:MAG: hypothetical protein ACR2IF_07175 [Terriglobales bacterium]
MFPAVPKRKIDFEEVGFRAMMQTQDESLARGSCQPRLIALGNSIKPAVLSLGSEIKEAKDRAAALWAQLYDRPIPVSDLAMLATRIFAAALECLLALALLASLCGQALTFYFFGFGVLLSAVVAIAFTGIAVATGHQAFERMFIRYQLLADAVILAGFVLCFWGLFQVAQSRAKMANAVAATKSTQSYVEDSSLESSPDPSDNNNTEQAVRQLLGSAIIKIMLAADFILGILLARLMKTFADEDFAGWNELKRQLSRAARCERLQNDLLAQIAIAEQLTIAGILRAKAALGKKRTRFYHSLPVIALVALLTTSDAASAQSIKRHEGILIDVSGSIGRGGSSKELLTEYLNGVKQLLATEPPDSRVWVSVITTDSFGSVRELTKGWTPSAHGVFTDDLNRARHQLAANFGANSASLSPIASGTDIIGALWHMKTLLDSTSDNGAQLKEIWIFSDMMNETASFPMPALLATGPERVLENAKANELVVPLKGYRVYVVGATTRGLTPQAWNTSKAFWTAYFRDAGAELVAYSAEVIGR